MTRILALVTVLALSLQAGTANADFATGLAAYQAGKYRAAYDEWQAEAWKDDARAQEGLAQLLESGAGTRRDIYEAYVWYRVADFHADVDLTGKLAELAARLPAADLGWVRREAHARYIEVLNRMNQPEIRLQLPATRHPAVDRDRLERDYGYTWVCDCGSVDLPEGEGHYQSFDGSIGSKFTF